MVKINLFAQLIQLLPKEAFKRLVKERGCDYANKGIDSWTQLVSMIFCQIGQAQSTRDISNGLKSITGNINHLGLERVPCKSSVSYENKNRDWNLFKDFYFVLLEHLCSQHSFVRANLRRLKRKVFILDASVISLCLSMYDWAKFRSRKGAVKLHVLLDYDGCLPVFAHVTTGKTHEINVARTIDFPKGSVVAFDRGYIDYKWLADLDSSGVYFVTRPKSNMDFYYKENFEIPEKEKPLVRQDADIALLGDASSEKYPKRLRLVTIWDADKQEEISFLTNHFSWTASTVAAVYKERWRIEIFFKQIKQNLHIKSFVGTSENAVLVQLWTAMITMLLLTFLKAKSAYDWHLSNMITFIRLNLFVKINLFDWLNKPFYKELECASAQLDLFSG